MSSTLKKLEQEVLMAAQKDFEARVSRFRSFCVKYPEAFCFLCDHWDTLKRIFLLQPRYFGYSERVSECEGDLLDIMSFFEYLWGTHGDESGDPLVVFWVDGTPRVFKPWEDVPLFLRVGIPTELVDLSDWKKVVDSFGQSGEASAEQKGLQEIFASFR